MGASSSCRSLLLALGLAAVAGRARSEPQAEATCVLASGNLLPGSEPAPPPWEALAGFRAGQDNRLRLVLATEQPGFLRGVSTSALLRMELTGLGRDEPPRLRDSSSWLGVAWQLSREAKLLLRAFPLDTDYLRIGYLHALDWGGTNTERRESVFLSQAGGVPGLELSVRLPRIQLAALLKWASVPDSLGATRRAWGSGARAALDLTRWLRLDAGLGFFQRPPTFVEGVSARLVWHRGAPEPELAPEPFRPPSLSQDPERLAEPAPRGFALALEGVMLVSRQRRVERPSAETLSAAPAGALYGSLRGRVAQVHGVLSWRSLAFVVHSDPRRPAEETLPSTGQQQPELGAWLGASLVSLPLRLVPSVETGARLPAALRAPGWLPGSSQTFVVGGAAGWSPLPLGAGRLPFFALRAALRWQASTALALSGAAEYQRDPNRARLELTPEGVMRRFDLPDSFSMLGAAQARF